MIGTNGGAITMTYRDYCEGAGCVRVFRHRTALSAVRDTLGRYVTFHYYGDGDYPADAAGAACGRTGGDQGAGHGRRPAGGHPGGVSADHLEV